MQRWTWRRAVLSLLALLGLLLAGLVAAGLLDSPL
jgi:hypothetical protein